MIQIYKAHKFYIYFAIEIINYDVYMWQTKGGITLSDDEFYINKQLIFYKTKTRGLIFEYEK